MKMSFVFLSAALLVMLSPALACAGTIDSCLPAGVHSTDVVGVRVERGKGMTVTVAEKLKDLKARCRKHKVVDGRGKEIRFYQLVGCWGNPPDDYQQQLERQATELAKLRKRYRVIEMTCDPSGDQRMRSGPPPANP